jgi:hypothetical protein
MTPPCRTCKYKLYPKMGKWVFYDDTDGRWRTTKGPQMHCTPKAYLTNRKMVPNPCDPSRCDKPRQYADWIAGHFITAPGTGESSVARTKINQSL